jgi:nicotinate-nucleotide adenylyltransferase
MVNLISTRRLGVQVGLFGGSFDPPHVGHAMVVSWLLWTEQVDEVWLMPAFEHPLDKALIPFAHRVKACQALASLFPSQVKVCEVERDLPRPSYTLNSLEALSVAHPETQFRLVAGSDILDQVDAWHKWDEITARFSPILVSRAGYRQLPESPVFPAVSSTAIREAISQGRTVEQLVPAGVLKAISGLYS